jgi:hypothetical protein
LTVAGEMDFKVEDEPVTEDSLAKLAKLVDMLERQKAEVVRLTAELSAANVALQKTSQQDIPQLVLQHGISRLRLKDGREVTVKPDVSVSFLGDKDDEEERKRAEDAFFQFLSNRGEMDIVKTQFSFGRMEDEKLKALVEYLEGEDYEYDSRRKVEPQTMKKYWRDLLGVNLEDDEREAGVKRGALLTEADVADGKAGVKIFKVYQTRVALKKGQKVDPFDDSIPF